MAVRADASARIGVASTVGTRVAVDGGAADLVLSSPAKGRN
jgi:hypothetical protein